MQLLQSTRGPEGEYGWPLELVKSATGLNMNGLQTRNGVIHATMNRARENSDPAPNEYLRLEPGKPPEFSPNPGGNLYVLSDGSPIIVSTGMRFLRLVDGDWQLWTQFPVKQSATIRASGPFIAADDSIWVADYRLSHDRAFLWRFFNKTWTAVELLGDFPSDATPDRLWIEEQDRIALAFLGQADTSGFNTIEIIDAPLPESLRPAP